jgi:hypothetical protein
MLLRHACSALVVVAVCLGAGLGCSRPPQITMVNPKLPPPPPDVLLGSGVGGGAKTKADKPAPTEGQPAEEVKPAAPKDEKPSDEKRPMPRSN